MKRLSEKFKNNESIEDIIRKVKQSVRDKSTVDRIIVGENYYFVCNKSSIAIKTDKRTTLGNIKDCFEDITEHLDLEEGELVIDIIKEDVAKDFPEKNLSDEDYEDYEDYDYEEDDGYKVYNLSKIE